MLKHNLKQENYSFFATKYISQEELQNTQNKIVIFGAPFDVGSSRPGSRFGPAVIRELSYFCLPNNQNTTLINVSKNETVWSHDILLDLGDLFLEQESTQNAINSIYNLISDLPKESIPLMIGGDHSLTYGSICSMHKKYNDNFTLIHFDQHLDMEICENHEKLDKLKHSNFISHIVKDFPDLEILQIGQNWLSSTNQPNSFSKHPQLLAISNLDIATHNFDVLKPLLPSKRNVYISFDVDVLHKYIIKNTGYPAPLGVSLEKALSILMYLCEHNKIIGADIMEFGSHQIYDFADETLIICNILALLITKIQQAERCSSIKSAKP